MLMSQVVDNWMLGRARVHRIEEWCGPFLTPHLLFAGFDADAYAACKAEVPPEYLDAASDALLARLQSWVIELDGVRVLIDTGAGNDKVRPGIPLFGGLQTPFLERLASAGFEAQDIDFVVCTHLHVDHVGWNTHWVDARWQPTFPRARYVFPQADAEYWDPHRADLYPQKIGAAVNEGFFDDSVRPILDAGLAELVAGPYELLPGLRLDPAPGHTPGSTVITLESAGEHALFVGDVVHHPLQVFNPDWNSIFCEDAAQARQTRRAVLERAADLEAVLVPAHFAGQHRTRVQRTATGLRPVGLDGVGL
jgi:glyoxylase-like metal-dependent hydrolase (beta-lactamase superfamily II)